MTEECSEDGSLIVDFQAVDLVLYALGPATDHRRLYSTGHQVSWYCLSLLMLHGIEWQWIFSLCHGVAALWWFTSLRPGGMVLITGRAVSGDIIIMSRRRVSFWSRRYGKRWGLGVIRSPMPTANFIPNLGSASSAVRPIRPVAFPKLEYPPYHNHYNAIECIIGARPSIKDNVQWNIGVFGRS